MNDYLNEYEVRLTTVGPVFIGSGNELNKKEYILLNDKILVMDFPKLWKYISEKRLGKDFEQFYLRDFRTDLSHWLRDYKIGLKDVRPYVKYEIEQSDTVLERNKTLHVYEFIKDPYGKPYVPGSSIKGMLRTILLCGELLSDRDGYSRDISGIRSSIKNGGKRNYYLLNEQKGLEASVFNRLNREGTRKNDAVNDVLSGLRVSDSEPLEIEDLMLCQRVEYHTDGTEKTLPNLRECIRPGVNVHFTITIDRSICPYSRKNIEDAVAAFSDLYNHYFRCKYHGIEPGESNSVYLGGSAGFVTKTDIAAMFDEKEAIRNTVEIYDKTNVPRNHKHYMDAGLGVSPHILKGVRIRGDMYHMGECSWAFCPDAGK